MSCRIVACALFLCLSGCGKRSVVSVEPATSTSHTNGQVIAEASGDCYDTDFDARLFRACQKISNDADAVNLFMWSMNTMYEARNDLDERTAQPKDVSRLKMAMNHHAIFQVDRGTMSVRVKHGGTSSPAESR